MTIDVRIVEVGPRDGLQNISQQVPTDVKIDLIQRLHKTGLNTIEVTSVVSPKAVPQLRDCRQVLKSKPVRALLQDASLRLPVLVPNRKGIEIAHQLGVREVAVFVSASEGFSKANINCTVEEGLARARVVCHEAKRVGCIVRGYVSCIFADPFDGPTPPSAVLNTVKALLQMGCYEISLGDTLGVGSPADVRSLIGHLKDDGVPLDRLAGHFHDTYGQALANVWEAFHCGIRVFDSSVAGLGGCPFAPGAKGNAATEDLVYMFDRAGVRTGVDLSKLVAVGAWISSKLSQRSSSRAGAALLAKDKRSSPSKIQPTKARPTLSWEHVKDTEGLVVHRSGANLKITMNRPRNGNALTESMIHDLITIFSDTATDPIINRIVLTGNGKFFCTGMDLSKSTPVGGNNEISDAQFNRLEKLFDTIDKSPKVTIACLNGPAFGGGVGLAFACDLRLCIKGAKVTLSEAKLGLCPATISKYVVREWGVPLAREAMLTARPFTPSELHAKGIVTRVVDDPGELTQAMDSLLENLRYVSSDALRMSKDLVESGWIHGGRPEQAATIKTLFDEMMKPSAPGSFGVKEFQAGRKVDWDNYKDKPRSKLLVPFGHHFLSFSKYPWQNQASLCGEKRNPMFPRILLPSPSTELGLHGDDVNFALPPNAPRAPDTDSHCRIPHRCTAFPPPPGRSAQPPMETHEPRPPSGAGVIKRIRQACANCRSSPSTFGATPRRMPSLDHHSGQTELSLDSIVQDSVLNEFSFEGLPPPDVVQSLVDTYFARVHNQPYSFFHRTSFYTSLANMAVPRCLLFAVLAFGVRFSDSPYFVGKVQEASDAYSRQSWLCVIEDHLSVDNNLELSVIQTVTLLAIVDYTAARVSSGWLRLGLAIRLSQDVDLMSEPPYFFTPTDREERRRTFWSIYLVDKLISCARSRPGAIADHDCILHLPCNEDVFQDRNEDGDNVPTLKQVLSWDVPLAHPPSPFGLAVVTSSIFGRCTKYAHGRSGGETLPPLDPKSDFASTNASLLLLESYLKNSDQPILDLIRNGPQADSNLDGKQAGHLVFAHALFHLCYCLLNHPFLIRLQLRPIAARVPKSFTSNAFHVAQENARKLTDLLIAGSSGVVPMESSFYTYCASIAAGIHSLAFGAQHQGVDVDQYDSRHYYQQCMDVLERLGVLWPMVPNMLTKLREFDAQSEAYSHLFDVSCLANELDMVAETTLWSLVDYGMLAREQPGGSPAQVSFLSNLPSPSKWNIPGGDFMSTSPTSEARNQLLFMGAQGP
ncbi:hypothetical protein ACJZ2D_008265 [Fusarium nematophilum]